MLSIGEFAQLGQVSPRTLRHYADVGVLIPARVDPVTGYRAPSMQGRLFGLTDKPSIAGAEKALSYEVGIKEDLFNRRARLSASVFGRGEYLNE